MPHLRRDWAHSCHNRDLALTRILLAQSVQRSQFFRTFQRLATEAGSTGRTASARTPQLA